MHWVVRSSNIFDSTTRHKIICYFNIVRSSLERTSSWRWGTFFVHRRICTLGCSIYVVRGQHFPAASGICVCETIRRWFQILKRSFQNSETLPKNVLRERCQHSFCKNNKNDFNSNSSVYFLHLCVSVAPRVWSNSIQQVTNKL